MDTSKLLYRIDEAAELISLSRSRVYELVRAGEIASVKVGRSRRIPADAVRRFAEGLAADQSAPKAS